MSSTAQDASDLDAPVLRVYPAPPTELALRGLYLGHGLHQAASARPLVYTNFITSLDGRIALYDAHKKTSRVPEATANGRDWRLFQELAAQADVVISTARYLRQVAVQQAQDVPPLSSDAPYADLHTWRREQGLSPQPAIAIVSASLDIPQEGLAALTGRTVHIFTGAKANRQRVEQLQNAGIDVHQAGPEREVEGKALVQALAALGFKSVYSVAGPQILHTLLTADVVDRLYLTFSHTLLGGEKFSTLVSGKRLQPPPRMRLRSLYHDATGPQQSFALYERDK